MSLFMYKGEPLAEPGNVDFGGHDISGIGDGTVTGAIVAIDRNTTQPVADSIYFDCYYRMVNGVKEWINPPMVVGVEYRTTERYMGKPVYVKLVNFGQLPNKTEKVVYNLMATGLSVIGMEAIARGSTHPYQICIFGHHSFHHCYYNKDNGAVCVKMNSNESIENYEDFHITFKYIKNTD